MFRVPRVRTSKKTAPSVRHFTLGLMRWLQDWDSVRYPSRYQRRRFSINYEVLPSDGRHISSWCVSGWPPMPIRARWRSWKKCRKRPVGKCSGLSCGGWHERYQRDCGAMTRSPLTQRAQALTLSHRGTNARQDDRRPPVRIMGLAYCLGHDFRSDWRTAHTIEIHKYVRR